MKSQTERIERLERAIEDLQVDLADLDRHLMRALDRIEELAARLEAVKTRQARTDLGLRDLNYVVDPGCDCIPLRLVR